jgi:hypothetical protein
MATFRRTGWAALLGLAFAFAGGGSAKAVSITVDENGHGTLVNDFGIVFSLPFTLQNDPGPGPQQCSHLFSIEPACPDGRRRSNNRARRWGPGCRAVQPTKTCSGGTGCLVFYSDNLGGVDALADTPTPPQALYGNRYHP